MREVFYKLFNRLPFPWKFARVVATWPGETWMLGEIVLARKQVEFEDGLVMGGATVFRRISLRDHQRFNERLPKEIAEVREPSFLAGALKDL